MRIVVFGANGPTGRQVVRQALVAGHEVVAVARRPEKYPLESPNLSVLLADVTDADSVKNVVRGADAVISTFGVPYSREPISVYSVGARNIIEAMTRHDVTRLICVSSASVPADAPPGETLFRSKVLHPFLRRVLGRTLYDDMQRMETLVQDSGLQWTIIRPAGLFDAVESSVDPLVRVGRRGPDAFTSRADLAQVLVAEVSDDQHPQAIVEVVTRSGTPFFPVFFAKEAFGIGA